MADNVQKTPLTRSLNRFTEQKIADALRTLGKGLPCHVTAVSGSIVTVAFDVNSPFTFPEVTCPAVGPEYVRYPIQVGDKGVTLSADVYIGGVSGLGGGTADLTLRGNLSALIFFPIASTEWSATDNPNAVVIYGPDGAVIRTVDKSNILTVDKTSVRTNAVLEAGNGATGTVTISGHTITASKGIVTHIS